MRMRQFVVATLIATAAFAAAAQDKVVYHIDDAATQALKGLRNIRNHLDTEPNTKITVVTHANGVDFLMEGAKDANGGAFAGPVSALVARGVTLRDLRDHAEEPQPEEGAVHPGSRTSRPPAWCASPSCNWPARPTSSPERYGRQSEGVAH